jgi:hypothetical protein
VVVGHRAVDGLLGDDDPNADHDDDRRVPEREPEAEAQRSLALVHQLAGGVVDRRDVVGVKRVAQPERIGQPRDPDPEALVVRGDDEQDEHGEPEDVKHGDRHEHQPGSDALARGEVPRDLGDVGKDPNPSVNAARHRLRAQ